MEQILNLQHISYTYHTLEGETPALSDISFSLNKGEFAAIVDFAGELAGLQREAPPRPRTVPETQSLRPDEPGESLPIDEVLMNASTVAGRLITVPKTFD